MGRRRSRGSKTLRFLRKVLRREIEPEADESLAFLTHAPGSLSREELEELERARERAALDAEGARAVEREEGQALDRGTHDRRGSGRPEQRAEPEQEPLDPWPVHPRYGRRGRGDALASEHGAGKQGGARRRRDGGGVTKRLVKVVGHGAQRGGRATVRMAKRVARGAGRVKETAGRDALNRTWTAFKLARRPRSSLPPPPRATAWERSFLLQLPGAFLRALAPTSVLAILGGTLLGAAALIMLKFSVWTGAFAVALAAAQLAALRLDHVRESAYGRDRVAWPDWDASFAAVPVYGALACLFLPAVLAALSAWGPGAWERGDRGSIPSRVDRLLAPGEAEKQVFRGALEAGEAYQARVWQSEELVREARREAGVGPGETDAENQRKRAQAERALDTLRRLAGEPQALGPEPPPRRAPASFPREAAQRAAEEVRAEAERLLDPRRAQGPHALAIGLLGGALFLFPMALLASTQLKSAYAVFHLPLLVRSILAAPVAYLICVAAFVAQDALLVLALVVPYAALSAVLEPLPAFCAAAPVTTLAFVALPLLSGSILGRLYRTRRRQLAWE